MTDIPICFPTDLQTYLGAPDIDDDRATLILELAQDLCESILTPLPDAARAVVLDVAARAYVNAPQYQSTQIGTAQIQFGAAPSGGLFLTLANKANLRRLAGGGGAFTISTMPDTAGQDMPWWDQAGWEWGAEQAFDI